MTKDLRSQVLDASVALIAEAGIAGLSMREVARRAEVSHQAPYHHFEDKESIVAALVERGFSMLADRMQAVSTTGTAEQRIARAGQAYVEFALDEPVYFRLMFRPELVDLRRFPKAEAAGARAFSLLRSLTSGTAGRRAAAKREAMVSLHWSLVHGLSSLLLDGPLGHQLPKAAERVAHVKEVVRLFASAFHAAS